MIKDSGARVEFASGAVRDIKEGVGRCDLLPLSVINTIINHEGQCKGSILEEIEMFQRTGKTKYLYNVLSDYISNVYEGDTTKAILELSIHFEEGKDKYGEWNWAKGIPVKSYISSGVRHYLKSRAGWDDESHDRAFMWNIVCAIWTAKEYPALCEIVVPGEGYVRLPDVSTRVVEQTV